MAINDNESKQRRTSATLKPKNSSKKVAKAASLKSLNRKEKLEAVRKANQAMMKAWDLISQRKNY